jgi:site-specific DNA-methyltransferase (adenine-specific)
MKLGPYELGYNDTEECGIYRGDAVRLMQQIPGQSIDIVFTSPPYNVGIKYEQWNDRLTSSGFNSFNYAWLDQAYRITNNEGRLYATVSDNMLWDFRHIAESVGWKFHQLLVWCKPNISGGSTRISKDWNLMAEWCLLFHREKRTKMRGDVFGINTHNWLIEASTQSNYNGNKRKVHPAQMSFNVAYTWIGRTPGDIVLDPFVGSGTTAQAAMMLDRQYLGFDNGKQTCDLARERVRNTQPPLFVEQPEQLGLELE